MVLPFPATFRPLFCLGLGLIALTAAPASNAVPVFETVQALALSPKGPTGELLPAADGSFYGTSTGGGTYAAGTIFKMAVDGTVTTVASFNGTNGSNPRAGLTAGADGNFYGVTREGGTSGVGTFFRVTPAGGLTSLFSFNGTNGSNPIATLAAGTDGNFYGTTESGGTSGAGTVFKVTTDGTLTTLANFNTTNGATPRGRLVQDANGDFYGTTYDGGTSSKGTVFKVTTGGSLTSLASFDSTTGSNPLAGLTPDGSGGFFGTTEKGGTSGNGTIFRVTTGGTITTLVNFDNVSGKAPLAALVAGPDGNFYGTTRDGGNGSGTGYGTFFRMTPQGSLTSLVSFSIPNGASPFARLTVGADGNLYGTTSAGGQVSGGANSLNGTIFRMTTAGVQTVMAIFQDQAGRYPHAGLAVASDGNLYGTATEGGGSEYGTVFRMTPDGVISNLHSFNGTDGIRPSAKLSLGTPPSGANLYGTTYQGGTGFGGTVFQITTAGVFTTTVNLAWAGTLGRYPLGPVSASLGSSYFFTTSEGGSGGLGTFSHAGAGPSTLISFGASGGSTPTGGLTLLSGGFYYGTTSKSSDGGKGTVFKIHASGASQATLANFTGPNGDTPVGELYYASNGTFYGATNLGGTSNLGTIYSLTTAGELTTLVNFNGTNGSGPRAGLVAGPDGNFYGTTEKGGTYDMGTVFRMTPDGTLATLMSFNGANGSYPWSALVYTPDGNLYGTTSAGGVTTDGTSGGGGQIFRIHFGPSVTTQPVSFIAGTTAVLRGSVNPNGVATTTSFQYGTDPALSTFTTVAAATIPADAGVTGIQATIGGLDPGATYYFRATATNAESSSVRLGSILSWVSVGVDPDAGPAEFLFCALDASRDDRLTLAEWQSIYPQIPRRETIFQAIDTDHDNFISFAEFGLAMSNRVSAKTITTAVQRTQAFLDLDTDANNSITRAEIAFMWKPGTASRTIDAYWFRANGGSDMNYWDWVWAKSLPSLSGFEDAQTIRAQRLVIAGQLDTDHDNAITLAEFSHLYPVGTRSTTIDTAWKAANTTPRGQAFPDSMTFTQFVEAPKLPKLLVY